LGVDQYRQLWEEMPCYLSVQDRELRVVAGNRLFRQDFGEGVGDLCYRVYKRRCEACPECPVRESFSDGKGHASEQTLITLRGEERQVMVQTTPILDASQQVVAVMEMHTDIGEVKRTMSRLSEIGLLVGTISHGIKGLLTGIEGGAYLVNSGFAREDDERVKRGWAMVERNVARIHNLVMNTLFFAKDRIPEMAAIDIADLLNDLRTSLEKRASDLGVVLETTREEGARSFRGDPQSIRTLLLNLLDNALDACVAAAASATSRVTLVVHREDPSIVFEVADNGSGMAPEARERLFSLLYSSKGSRGTGLGLYVAAKIAAEHGGSIAVESEQGRGTCVRVRLPLAAAISTSHPPLEEHAPM